MGWRFVVEDNGWLGPCYIGYYFEKRLFSCRVVMSMDGFVTEDVLLRSSFVSMMFCIARQRTVKVATFEH